MAGEVSRILRRGYLADVLLLGVTCIWGTTFVLVQDAIKLFPVMPFLTVRFLLGGILLFLPVLLLPRYRVWLRSRVLWARGVWLGVWLFAGYVLQTVGLLYTSPARSGFITGLCVVLVPVFAWLILKKRTAKAAWIGVAVATVGLLLLSDNKAGLNVGDLLTLLCAISFAIQIVYVGKFAPDLPALPLAAVQIFAVGVLSLIASLLSGVHTTLLMAQINSPTVLWALIICTLLATVLAYFAQTAFQKFTTPTRTALIFATEPVFAAIAAYLWTSERLSAIAWLGCALILGGMLIAELGGTDQAKAVAPDTGQG